jgi:hypothetical protein
VTAQITKIKSNKLKKVKSIPHANQKKILVGYQIFIIFGLLYILDFDMYFLILLIALGGELKLFPLG